MVKLLPTKNKFGRQGCRKQVKKVSLNKKERRQLKLKSKKHYEIITELLPLWEELRKEQTPSQQRFQIINEILKISKNKLVDLCMAHDTSRICECSIQHATQLQRWQIYNEIKKDFIELSKSRYGKFVMLKIIKYGEKEHRMGILKVFKNRLAHLLKHKFACEVVDTLYNDYATAKQRGEIMQELFGNKSVLQLTENSVYTLDDLLKLHVDKKMVLMNNLTLFMILLINKGLNKYSIVQNLILNYLKTVNSEAFRSSIVNNSVNMSTHYQITESVVPMPIVTNEDGEDGNRKTVPKSFEDNFLTLLEMLIESQQIVPMLHTRDGVRIALHVLWASNVAKRKLLVKGLKTCIVNIAMNEHGYLFIMGLLDCVDDVVLLQKTVIKEMLEDLDIMIAHPNARKVLLFALSPRDRHHFSPQFISSLFSPANQHIYTKKSLAYRALELRTVQTGLLPTLLRIVENRVNELFIGNCYDEDEKVDKLLFTDLGRLVILGEILSKSAPYHLDPKYGTLDYKRSSNEINDTGANEDKDLSNIVSNEDINILTLLRKRALKSFVIYALVPKFTLPEFDYSNRSASGISTDQLRINRRRKAIHNFEEKLAKERKLTIKPFVSCEFENKKDDVCDNSSNIDDKYCERRPFMERSESHYLLRRLLQEDKLHKDSTFGRIIMKYVPAENFVSWARCNRTCFILVNLYELGDLKICNQLRECLTPVLNELTTLQFPGAKIICKYLSSDT